MTVMTENTEVVENSQIWYQTYTGVKFNPIYCGPEDIRIEDIAHALANYPRFGGHTRYVYSVAQHSCLVHDKMPRDESLRSRMLRLQALLHDATEAYLGDVVKPLKELLPEYKAMERRLEKMIFYMHKLPDRLEPEVKAADLTALATEKRDLLYNGPVWEALAGIEPWPETVVPWQSPVAKEQFLARYYTLVKQPPLQSAISG